MPEARQACSPRVGMGDYCPRNRGDEQAVLEAELMAELMAMGVRVDVDVDDRK